MHCSQVQRLNRYARYDSINYEEDVLICKFDSGPTSCSTSPLASASRENPACGSLVDARGSLTGRTGQPSLTVLACGGHLSGLSTFIEFGGMVELSMYSTALWSNPTCHAIRPWN